VGDNQIRSRRALLTAAASGAAAVAASAALPAAVVRAADQPFLLNVPNTSSAMTSLSAPLDADPVLAVQSTDALQGTAVSGTAVTLGVYGHATGLGTGVYGSADGAGGTGVRGGTAATATGVYGIAGTPGDAPTDTTYTGVFGYADSFPNANAFGTGVWGSSPDVGVYGSGATGVYGDGGTTGVGVFGYSGSGFGLWVDGKVRFSKRAGKFTVAKGKTSYTKTGLTGITSATVVVAVFQGSVTGTWIRAAKAGTNSITVYFSKALPATATIGWLAIN
jgi:hypothetical protein